MFILTDKKRCSKCGEWKDKSEFHTFKRGASVFLRPECKECKNAISIQYRKNNQSKLKEYFYNLGRTKERRDYKLESSRRWAANNPEKIRESNRKAYKNNPETSVVTSQNYRAKKKANGGKITMQEWQTLKEFYNYTCLCCGKREPEIKLALDHVIPISLGGANVISNAQPLCQSCNSSKRNKEIDYR